MVHFRFLACGFVVVALSGCGTASIPDEMRGIFEGQQSGVNRFLPVITLNGSQEVTLEVFSSYQEFGASAQSLRDGVINPSNIQISSNLNTSVLGQYSIVYNVTDSGGRFSSITRTVNVVDTTVPVIGINQNSTVMFEKLGFGNSNTLPYNDGVPGFNGVVATDNYDAAINSKISAVSNVNSSSEGDYFVTYNVADQSNNPAIPKSRIVQVRDTKAPGISIGAPSSSIVSAGEISTLDLSFQDASVIGLDGKLQIVPINGAVISCQINSSGAGLESRQITVSNCSGNGSFKVKVLQGAALDNATLPAPNQTAMVESAEIVVDNDGPTVTIGSPSVSFANFSTMIEFPLTVSDAASNQSIANNEVDVLGGIGCSSKTVLNGNSTTPTVRLSSCSGNGELRIRVNQGAVRDSAQNQSPEVISDPVTVDNTAPTVSISAPSIAGGFQALRNASGSSAQYTVTYSGASAVTLSLSDISLNTTGGASCLVGVSGTGSSSRLVTLSSCTGNGTVGISIQASTAVDLAGNAAPAAGPSATVTIDNTAPTISISAPSIAGGFQALRNASGSSAQYTVTYSGASAVTLSLSDISLNTTGGASCLVGVSGTGSSSRLVTLSSCTGNGTVGISIQASTAVDLAGNAAPAAGPSATVTIDNTAPTISISAPSINGGFANIRNAAGSSAQYTVTYSGASAVTLSLSDISLNTTGGASCLVGVSGTGSSSRLVTLSSCTGNGTVGISIQASTATDLAGNAAPAAGPSNTVTVDNTAPVFSFGATGSNIDLCSSSTAYLTQGVSVNETLSGAFSVQSNNVDRLVAGNYQVVFVGTDLAGNQGSGTRSVDVNPLSLGSGDQNFSFEFGVSTAQNFLDRMVTSELNGNAQNSLNVALCNDINLNDQSITTRARLNGRFDGQGFTIRNAQINPSSNGSSLSQASLGLFQTVLSGGLIRNLRLDNIRVGDPTDLRDHTGVVTGRNMGRIERLQVLNSRVEGRLQSGGLVGWNLSSGLIFESASSAIVVAEEIVGGLIGLNNGSLANSYRGVDQAQEPSVQISRPTGGIVGGLAGRSDGSIVQSYSNAHDVCDGTHDFEGGLVGDGSNSAFESYFNSQLSRCTGVGELSDEQMKMPMSFTGFDTVAFWNLITGEYPELKWLAGQ